MTLKPGGGALDTETIPCARVNVSHMQLPTAALAVAFLAPAAVADDAVSFRKDIAPILAKHCQGCHGAKEAKSKYRLDSFDRLMKPGASEEPVVMAGKPKDSALFKLLVTAEKDERMPKKADALPAAQIALVKKWIEQGATYDGGDATLSLTDIMPKVEHPAAPAVYSRPVPITALAFSNDGQALAVGGYHEVTIWNPADGKLIRRIGGLAQRTYGIAFSADGNTLAVAGGAPGEMGEVRLVNFADGKLIAVLVSSTDVVLDVKYSRDGKLLAACGADNLIRVFDTATNQLKITIANHSDWVSGIAFNADGTRLASASRDKTAKVFDLTKNGEMIGSYLDHNDQVHGVAFHPDGDKVYSCGKDRRIMLWNIGDSKRTGEMGLGGEVFELVLDGDALLACSADKSARLFNAKDRSQKKQFNGHQDWVYSIASNATVKRAASGAHDGEVRVWNTDDGKEVAAFIAAPGYATSGK